MNTPAVFLLPPLNPECAPDEPITHLLEALDHIAATPCTAARDADGRRELLYYTATELLTNTYPADQRKAIYERHAARCSSLTAAEQRTATLAMYGLACDRASGTRHRDGHTWAAAAIAALETYRARKTDRPLRGISGHPA